MSADLAVLLADPESVERFADPGEYIVQCCERGRDWLKAALERDDLESVLECKAQAEAIRVYTVSKNYGADARLSAEEIIRRAERGLALAVRKGQEKGEVSSRADGGWGARNVHGTGATKKNPAELVGSGGQRSETYALADGVSDEDFEDALAEGRAEGNLSRQNMARKGRQRSGRTDAARDSIAALAAEGHSSRQIAGRLGMNEAYIRQLARGNGIQIKADEIVGRTRHHDSNRIVRETASALEGLAMGVRMVEKSDLDRAEIADWAASLTESLRALNRLARQLREMTQP